MYACDQKVQNSDLSWVVDVLHPSGLVCVCACVCRVPNACDVCPSDSDDQADTDNDGVGDKCGT